MQRDLKFRMPINNADGTFKEWFYWGFYGGAFIVPHSMFGSCPSQQFTGLKDKDGVDIYEGDIVLGNDVEFTVCWDETLFCFTIEYVNKEDISNTEYAWQMLSDLAEDYIEIQVIGNTTENQELSK